MRQSFVEWAAQTIPRSYWAGAFYAQPRTGIVSPEPINDLLGGDVSVIPLVDVEVVLLDSENLL
jgi:hypothetical protein